jgi:hypothetical protein
MDPKEKKTVVKLKVLLSRQCCGDPCDLIKAAKKALKRENLGKLVYRRTENSKGELFYISKAKDAFKIAEMELVEKQLQDLNDPGAFEIR